MSVPGDRAEGMKKIRQATWRMQGVIDTKVQEVARAQREGCNPTLILAEMVTGLMEEPEWEREGLVLLACMAIMQIERQKRQQEER